jgi:hypothetical protein
MFVASSAFAQSASSGDAWGRRLSLLAQDARSDRHTTGALVLGLSISTTVGIIASASLYENQYGSSTVAWMPCLGMSLGGIVAGTLSLAMDSQLELLSIDYQQRLARGESPEEAQTAVTRRWREMSDQAERARRNGIPLYLSFALLPAMVPVALLIGGDMSEGDQAAVLWGLGGTAIGTAFMVYRMLTPFEITRTYRLWSDGANTPRVQASLGAFPLRDGGVLMLSGTFLNLRT